MWSEGQWTRSMKKRNDFQTDHHHDDDTLSPWDSRTTPNAALPLRRSQSHQSQTQSNCRHTQNENESESVSAVPYVAVTV